MSGGKRALIINADDFGWSPEVNEGILKAHQEGVVTSVSLLTTLPGFEDAVTKIKATPNLDVGIHLNACRGIKISSIRESFDWQVQQALRKGISISHLDTEKHLHCLPFVFKVVLELAEKYQIRAVRFPFEKPRVSSLRNPLQLAKVFFMSLFGKKNKKLLAQTFIKSPDLLLGVCLSKRFSLGNLKRAIAELPEGVFELSCHPGLTPHPFSSYIDRYREEELNVLTHPGFKEFLHAQGIQLIRFADLAATTQNLSH